MATLKLGPIVIGVRGTIAGITFSANQSGPYARGWSKGANPNSAPQSAQRGRIGALAAAWRDLSQAQRDDWIIYAALPAQDLTNSLSETYSISGFNWWIKINSQLEAAGESRRVDAPTLTRPVAPIIESWLPKIFGAATQTRVTMTIPSPNLGFNHVVFCRVFSSQGRGAAAANFTFCIIDVPNVSRQVLFRTEWDDTFGVTNPSQEGFVQINVQDAHGQRGPIDTDHQNVAT